MYKIFRINLKIFWCYKIVFFVLNRVFDVWSFIFYFKEYYWFINKKLLILKYFLYLIMFLKRNINFNFFF